MNAKISKKKVKMYDGPSSKAKNSKKKIEKPKGSFDPEFIYKITRKDESKEDGKILKAFILDKFIHLKEKDEQDELSPEHYQYYIHYYNLDR